MAVDWPDLETLTVRLNVDGDLALHDDDVAQALQAAIDKVQSDVGDWDELVDEPDEALSQAALRMAELMAARPMGVAVGGFVHQRVPDLDEDPTYKGLLYGHRRSNFGVG